MSVTRSTDERSDIRENTECLFACRMPIVGYARSLGTREAVDKLRMPM